jgi:DnaJ-class molecular chaperone
MRNVSVSINNKSFTMMNRKSALPHFRFKLQVLYVSLLLLLLLLQIESIAGARKDLYQTLGIPKTATQKEITKAYRKLALKHHPDKVPESEREASEKKFKEIGYAHEILSDAEKRKRYDTFGEQGLENNFQPGFNGASSPFGPKSGFSSQTFSFGGMPQSGSGVDIDLSDLLRQFMGAQGGMGGFGGGMDGGFGNMGRNFGGTNWDDMMKSRSSARSSTSSLRPQTMDFYCTLGELSDMNGCKKKLKVTIPISDPFSGQQRTVEKIYTIDVQPGWKSGTKVRFKASKDGMFPPMTFVMKQKRHKFLDRQGDDLVYTCTVSDRQAEKGAKLKIPLPDGEILRVQTLPDEIVQNYVKEIKGKGMPIRGAERDSNQRGNLLIKFNILGQSSSSHQYN